MVNGEWLKYQFAKRSMNYIIQTWLDKQASVNWLLSEDQRKQLSRAEPSKLESRIGLGQSISIFRFVHRLSNQFWSSFVWHVAYVGSIWSVQLDQISNYRTWAFDQNWTQNTYVYAVSFRYSSCCCCCWNTIESGSINEVKQWLCCPSSSESLLFITVINVFTFTFTKRFFVRFSIDDEEKRAALSTFTFRSPERNQCVICTFKFK